MKRMLMMALGVVLLALIGSVQPASASAIFYELVPAHSNKCIDVPGASMDSGVLIQQYDCHGGDNQLWRLVPINETLRIYEIQSLQSKLCLDVPGASFTTVQLQQYPCHGGDNQQFQLFNVSAPFQIVARNSGMCLDIYGAYQFNGAALQQYPCTGGANQLFNFF